jgi:hypothetical protein
MSLGIFIGKYKGVSYYADKGNIRCLFGWVPQSFYSMRQFKLAVTRWQKAL